jgi:transposase InsO family protein
MTEALKPPYDRQDDARGDFQIWIVDGPYIRGHIDEEFTNFGQHYRYPYIPDNEFWIDQEAAHDERVFFIDHLLVEHEMMAKGASYDEALAEADRTERRERRRAGDVRKVTHEGRELPDPSVVRERLWKKLENGVSVWVVNGRLVRSAFDTDFTAGGHDHVYEFVPSGEVWIDDAIQENERAFVLLHELHERNRMAEGVPYSKAHVESSRLEFRCRHHPDELHDALAEEGWA